MKLGAIKRCCVEEKEFYIYESDCGEKHLRFCGMDLCGVHPALSIEKEYPPGMPDRDVYTIAGRDGETAVAV